MPSKRFIRFTAKSTNDRHLKRVQIPGLRLTVISTVYGSIIVRLVNSKKKIRNMLRFTVLAILLAAVSAVPVENEKPQVAEPQTAFVGNLVFGQQMKYANDPQAIVSLEEVWITFPREPHEIWLYT